MAWEIIRKKLKGKGFRTRRFKWGTRFRRKSAALRHAKVGRDRVRKIKVAAAPLNVVSRAQWHANSVSLESTDWNHATTTRVHHTVGGVRYTSLDHKKRFDDECRFMRETEAFHVQSRGYRAIGYNFVIMPTGRVFEGRGKEKVGAHTLGHNHDCGISFAGNFENEVPTQHAIEAYHALRNKLGLNGAEHSHSDTFPTSCCGRNLKKALGL